MVTFLNILYFDICIQHTGYKSDQSMTQYSRKTFNLISLFHADCCVYLENFFFLFTKSYTYVKSFLSHKLRGARSQPETSKAIGQPVLRHLHVIYSRATEYICLDYPWNKPVPILPPSPIPPHHHREQAPRKADKWSQFVHFMRSYIIRETSHSHLRRAKVYLSPPNLNFKFLKMLRCP